MQAGTLDGTTGQSATPNPGTHDKVCNADMGDERRRRMAQYSGRQKLTHEEWKKFVGGATASTDIIPPGILDSWFRCRTKGVDPYLKKVPQVLEKGELEKLLRKNRDLIAMSRPFMEHLYGFVKGSSFVVALSDADGYLIELVGDHEVLESVKKGNFVLGACWSEDSAGSNGVGTVLKLERALQVVGCEHYCLNSHKWTCSGAPIHDPEGRLAGIIDMTGPYELANCHTLGMVVASAHAIENEIRLKKALAECLIADSFQRTVISSIPEVIIAVDNDGTITLMNNNAKKTFGPDAEQFLGRDIHSFWKNRNAGLMSLIDNNESLTDVEVRITFKNNQADFTLSCYPILSMDSVTGKIIILDEIKRARTLATRMMGAKAKLHFGNIIGVNARFREGVRQAEIASKSNSNVLLLGESGTGKDIFAQAIHNNSARKDGPYVAINCATIPRDLIASELFGYTEGAFTGSRKGGNQGKFELADGGTIFLDEFAETPLELQAALLRVMEDKCIIRIGGTKYRTINVRIIAASNKDLKEEVRKGRFREDLYYRSNVFAIHMVPLRNRKDDIPLLVHSFVAKIVKSMNKTIHAVDKDVLEGLIHYHWPGNVRELQNVLERMINIAHTDRLTFDLLPPEVLEERSMEDSDDSDVESVNKIERQLITRLMGSNISKKEIARKLNISRSTLYRKLEKYGMGD